MNWTRRSILLALAASACIDLEAELSYVLGPPAPKPLVWGVGSWDAARYVWVSP